MHSEVLSAKSFWEDCLIEINARTISFFHDKVNMRRFCYIYHNVPVSKPGFYFVQLAVSSAYVATVIFSSFIIGILCIELGQARCLAQHLL